MEPIPILKYRDRQYWAGARRLPLGTRAQPARSSPQPPPPTTRGRHLPVTRRMILQLPVVSSLFTTLCSCGYGLSWLAGQHVSGCSSCQSANGRSVGIGARLAQNAFRGANWQIIGIV